jgi:hypothetical protein
MVIRTKKAIFELCLFGPKKLDHGHSDWKSYVRTMGIRTRKVRYCTFPKPGFDQSFGPEKLGLDHGHSEQKNPGFDHGHSGRKNQVWAMVIQFGNIRFVHGHSDLKTQIWTIVIRTKKTRFEQCSFG